MARNRTRELSREPLGGDEYLVTELYYSLGGMNYFTGSKEPRGYYVSVTPTRFHEGGRSFTAFSGIKKLVEPAKAFSAKEFAGLVILPEVTEPLRQHVLAKRQHAA